MSLRDPKFAETFTGVVTEKLAEALGNDILLHGQRTENMFKALVVSLGYYNNNYALAMNCPLKFALYWARWRIWTLIDADDLAPMEGKLGIDMLKATSLNELARLGDRMIGTKPPLKLRLFADKSKPRFISADGEACLTVSHAVMFCGDINIIDPVERNIAWIFMEFGDWDCGEPQASMSGSELNAIELRWMPRERANEREDFEMIGTLSSMFSRYYATQTLAEEGVVQTEAELTPDWFAPLVANDQRSGILPLWRFILQVDRSTPEA